MALSPFADKAQLTVNIGQTTVEDLRAFQDKAGSGEIRAKANKDGSYTLYVSADKKPRISDMFKGYGAEQRAAKQTLAKTLIAEIVTRRLPSGSMAPKDVMQNIDQGGTVRDLKQTLDRVDQLTYTAIPQDMKRDFVKSMDAQSILKVPELRPKLEQMAAKQFAGENVEFLKSVESFGKNTNVDKAMEQAEAMFEAFNLDEAENGGKTSFLEGGNEPDINLSGETLKKLRTEMNRLRQLHASEGGITKGKDTLALKNLFKDAAVEINKMTTKDVVRNFKQTPEFKSFVNEHLNASNVARNNPNSHALPGSGKEILDRFESRYGKYTSLDRTLSDPQARGEFKAFVAGKPEATHLKNLEALERLGTQVKTAGADGVSNTQLLQLVQQFANRAYGPEQAPVQEGEGLDVAPELEPDPFLEMINNRAEKIGQQIVKENEMFGSDLHGDEFGDSTFGGKRGGLAGGPSARQMIQDMVNDLIGDSVNGLKTKEFEKFSAQKLEGSEKIGQELAIEQADEQGSVIQFLDKESVSSGGATGSGTKKVGKQGYQEKGGYETKDSLLSKIKMGFSNAENYGELMASNIAQGMLPEEDRGLSPDVMLRRNPVTNETFITSKWLAGGQGDLNAYYKSEAGLLPGSEKRIKVNLGSNEPSGNGVVNLSGPLAKDMMQLIMTRALLGDHDCNVGNFVIVKTEDGTLRAAGIDYGHALNDLISGTMAPLVGGGVKFEGNRILDFFNRETVNHLLPSKQASKLWRDFDGIQPSPQMAEAFRESAKSVQGGLDGLAHAKQQFTEILTELQKDTSPSAKARIEDFTKSLKAVASNIGMPEPKGEPGEIIDKVFEGVANFLLEGAQQMNDMADLCSFQAKVNQFIATTEPGTPIPQELQEEFQSLREKPGIGSGKEDGKITFMKQSRDVPAFKGDLAGYIQNVRSRVEE